MPLSVPNIPNITLTLKTAIMHGQWPLIDFAVSREIILVHRFVLVMFVCVQRCRPFKCYAMGWGVYRSVQISITKVQTPTLLALRVGGGGVQFPGKSIMKHLNDPYVQKQLNLNG